MASSIYITDADGTNYHLAGAGTSYTGSGTPWTAQATSPYQLAMNDVTGPSYTPQAPPPLEIYNGGPPFRVGADLSFRGYGNVTETFGVQMYASSHDNAVALLRTLRRALSTTLASRPPILVVQPDSASNAAYYEVYGATVQELPSFINEEAGVGGTKIVRALVTWTRSPFGGNLGTWDTLVNGTTVANTGTGTPDNVESLGSSGTGELTKEGGPLNVQLTFTGDQELLVATIAGRTYTNRSDSLVTSSTTGAGIVTIASIFDPSALITNRNLKIRILGRVTNASATLQVRVLLIGGDTLYTSPWVQATTSGGSNVLLDFGGVALPMYYRTLLTSTPSLSLTVQARSTTGAATTGVLDYVEVMSYYTFGIAKFADNTTTFIIEQFVQRSGLPALPIPTRGSGGSSGALAAPRAFVGTPPVYISGASLYVAWRTTETNAHDAADTETLTVTHAPLYHTLRGGG